MNTEPQQPEDLASLYRRAFAEYGARALWNKCELEAPTPAAALVVARAFLRLLAAHRDPESMSPGATPLNRNAPRISGDIDVFHDREERVAAALE